jgi:hypothetical protein
MGEAFLYAQGFQKWLLGIVSGAFAISVPLDLFKERARNTVEKVLYLFSFIPISDPKTINYIVWFVLAFILLFILSIGTNFTRQQEKMQSQINKLKAKLPDPPSET